MNFYINFALGALLAATHADAKVCSGKEASECVQLYRGSSCDNAEFILDYTPTCEGNCYVYDFESLKVFGSTYQGTDCVAYSDRNCQDEIGDTGNIFYGLPNTGHCQAFAGGKSMKCYHGC